MVLKEEGWVECNSISYNYQPLNLDLELEGGVEAVAELEVEQHPIDDLQDSIPTSSRLLHLKCTGCHTKHDLEYTGCPNTHDLEYTGCPTKQNL